MPVMNSVPVDQLPTSRMLLRSTLIAAVTATVLLVTIVLPAEYAIDPTGVGGVLGLTRMGEIKVALAAEADAAAAAEAVILESKGAVPPLTAPAAISADSASSDVTRIDLLPGQGREIKVVMPEGTRVTYEWSVEGGVVNSDTHADRPGTPYHGYAKGRNQASDAGVLVAAFDGKHGWFWRNRGDNPVTVTLKTTGSYTDLQEVK